MTGSSKSHAGVAGVQGYFQNGVDGGIFWMFTCRARKRREEDTSSLTSVRTVRVRGGGNEDESRRALLHQPLHLTPTGEVRSESVLTLTCTSMMNSWRNKSCSFFLTFSLSACVCELYTKCDISDVFNPRSSRRSDGKVRHGLIKIGSKCFPFVVKVNKIRAVSLHMTKR